MRKILISVCSIVVLFALAGCAAPQPPDPVAKFENSPHKEQSLERLASAAQDANDFGTSAQLYRKLISEGHDTEQNRLGLADSLFGGGDLEGATSEYIKAASFAPADAAPELGLGRLYLFRHKAWSALAAFTLALQSDPKLVVAYNGKGIALDQLARHDEAQSVYRQGLDIDPDDRALRNNLGLSLVLSGKLDAAVQLLTALSQDPQATPRNRQNLALALGLQGDVTDAKMVAAHDLDETSIDNNLRYYDFVRNMGGSTPTPQVQ